MDRRGFLISGAAGAVALELGYEWFKAPAQAAGFEMATAYGDWVDTFIEKADPPLPSEIVFFDPGSMRLRNFPVPFRVHMLVQNPIQRGQLIMVSKWGREIASFDFTSGKIAKVKLAVPGRRFFGHAVWDHEAGGFWVTEQDDNRIEGRLSLRGPDLEVMHEVSSGGIFPHELQMPEPGVILVANSGDFFNRYRDGSVPLARRISNLSWINTRDGSLKRQVEFPSALGTAGASHFSVIQESGDVIVGTMAADMEQPATVFRVHGQSAERLAPNAKKSDLFRGEIVSFAQTLHDRRVLWTHSKAPGVFSCSFDAGSKAELVIPARSRGVAEVDGDVIVTHASKNWLIRLRNGEIMKKTAGPGKLAHRWGSHLVRLKPV